MLWAWFALFGLLPVVVLAVQVGSLTANGLPSGDLDSLADSIKDFGTIALVTGGLNVLAAIVWIIFVRQLTNRHTGLTGET